MKRLRKLIIYTLLLIGTIVMIAPFAWMLVTSFKLPSEVNSWPPKWTTKSFLSQREVKVIPSTGTTSSVKGLSLREALTFVSKKTHGLVLLVNDDPFYRGKLTIRLKGKTYAKIDPTNFYNFINSIKQPTQFLVTDDEKNNPELYFEKVLLNYVSGSTPVFKRDIFIDSLTSSIETLLDGIDTIQTFGIERIQNENEKSQFIAFLDNKVVELQELKTKIQKFKSGESLILSIRELEEIHKLLTNYNLLYSGSNEVSDNYNSAIANSIYKNFEEIDFFLKIYSYFVSVQKFFVDRDIVAKPMSDRERINLLIERTKDLKDHELIKKIISKNGMDNLLDEFAKVIDENVQKMHGISSNDLTTLKSLINAIVNVGFENNLNVEDELKVSFKKFMEKLESVVGFNLTYTSAKSKLDAFSQEYKSSDELFKTIALNILELQSLRMIYENTKYAWKLIDAPKFVSAVLVKEGKNIEIVMEDVSPVYFMDDGINKVQVSFSTMDILKNVFQNYALAWNSAPFGRYYFNTVFISVVTTILEVIISAMAAYAFSWMNFPGKSILFSVFLATMMVPGEVLLVPNFITITKFGWIDTYYALIIPWVVSVFSIFLMRQHFMSLPSELFDAAKIDGCSHWRYLWQIVVPLSKPVVITSALLKFVGSWNSFLWVLIVTNSPKYRTLTVGLSTFSSEVGTLYNMLMAAATFSILPVVIIFLFTQKYFVRGIARTGLK
ncbi:MAG: ABC transporter permease subunit [Fervidobacterium sp.]|nr:ABC transporter permease subunit [Fervidobacterium sp.]